MLAGLIIVSIVAAVSLAAAAWLYAHRQAAMRERDQVATDRDELEATNAQHLRTIDELRSKISELNGQIGRAEEREKSLRESFEQAQKQARETFDSLAAKTLRQTVDDFRKNAEAMFKVEQEKSGQRLDANQKAIDNLVKPVKDSLEKYQTALVEAEKERKQAYGSLSEQARAIADSHQRLDTATRNLVQALRRPEVRGRWGELQMERLFELAGMTEYVDYDEQARLDSGEGQSLRPDFTINLPNDRTIVVDVKTPIDAYISAIEATDDAVREQQLDRHVKQVSEAANNLAGKSYQQHCAGSPEFVVMFIPGESMLYAAAQRDPHLIERAMDRNVIIATPTVMIALLKTVAMGWREKSLAENAEKIASLGKELHERLATVAEHVQTLGKRMDSAVQQYNRMVGSFDSRLLPTARKFTELKANSAKQAPDSLDPLEIGVRDTQALLTAAEDQTQP